MNRSHLAAFAAAGLLGGGSSLAAQTAAPPTFAATVVVTATATPEPAESVPATLDAIDAVRIERRQATFALDLLREIAGVAVTRSGSPGKVASLFTRGTNSNHTLVLWNGVTLNDAYLGGFDLSLLATDGADRIEVVRGPYSALYGSSAFGGVIQVVTERPAPGAGARAEAGAHGHRLGALTAAHLLGPVAGRVAGHWRTGDGEVANDDWESAEADLFLDADWSPRGRVGLLVRWNEGELGIPRDFTGAPLAHRRQESEGTSFAVPFDWAAGDWSLEAKVARSATELAVADADDPFAASAVDAEREEARLLVRRAAGERFTVTLGADADRERAESSSAFGAALTGEHQRTVSGFAQVSYASGPLRLDVGARRDDNDAFGGETSARGAAAWALAGGWRVRAGYGEAFRAPSLADLYYPGFSNPELEPERTRSAELAVERSSGRLDLALALFSNRLEHLIEFDFATFTPQNLGRARARGAEATLALAVARGDGRLTATWLDAEDRTTGEPLLRRPEWSASLELFARPERFEVGAIGRYVGRRVDFGEVGLPAHTVVDVVGRWRSGRRVDPYARIENLLDRDYEEAAGFPAPGRSWTAGLAFASGS